MRGVVLWREDKIMPSRKNQAESKFAARVLLQHLSAEYGERVGVSVNPDTQTPPDLLATVNLEHWGIEVTNLSHEVEQIGSVGALPFETFAMSLERIGKALGEKLIGLRKLGYVLAFEAPGGLGGWKTQSSFRHWKKKAFEALTEHVTSGSRDVLRGPGYSLRPIEGSDAWFVVVSPGPHAVAPKATKAIERALLAKSADLDRWKTEKERFDKRWLAIINRYMLLGFDMAASKIRSRLRHHGIDFDGVLYIDTCSTTARSFVITP
jgi:hypothetical protein